MTREELRHKYAIKLKATTSGTRISQLLLEYERELEKASLPPAEGAESAESFIKRKHPQDWDEIPQWHIDELNEFAAQQQPTAEGAEEMDARTYLDEWMRQHNYRSNKLIGWSEAVDFADDFATLHAQRIADKMVDAKTSRNGC